MMAMVLYNYLHADLSLQWLEPYKYWTPAKLIRIQWPMPLQAMKGLLITTNFQIGIVFIDYYVRSEFQSCRLQDMGHLSFMQRPWFSFLNSLVLILIANLESPCHAPMIIRMVTLKLIINLKNLGYRSKLNHFHSP